MPTRKQRRRAQKAKRHEYEYVYVDGRATRSTVAPERAEELASRERNGSKPAAPTKQAQRARRRASARSPPPSWSRVLKRGGSLGAAHLRRSSSFVADSGTAGARALAQRVVYTAFFIPFTYLMDRFAYRAYLRRGGETRRPAKKR